MAITNGTYKARACGECVLGESKKKETPFIEVYFEILAGENAGGKVRWTGYMKEGSEATVRTIEALITCGWKGEDPSEFSDGKLHGLDKNEVEIVVELEEYTNDEGDTRKSPRVQWVNKSGGFLNTAAKMSPQAAQSFGDRMRGLVLKTREAKGAKAPDDGTSFDHGANQSPEAKKQF